jgi:hypothetical protein
MRKHTLTTPEIGFIAATRAAAGCGLGLLLAERLSGGTRRTLGWALLAFGAVTTAVAAKIVFGR